jgi:hypothetical protein
MTRACYFSSHVTRLSSRVKPRHRERVATLAAAATPGTLRRQRLAGAPADVFSGPPQLGAPAARHVPSMTPVGKREIEEPGVARDVGDELAASPHCFFCLSVALSASAWRRCSAVVAANKEESRTICATRTRGENDEKSRAKRYDTTIRVAPGRSPDARAAPASHAAVRAAIAQRSRRKRATIGHVLAQFCLVRSAPR